MLFWCLFEAVLGRFREGLLGLSWGRNRSKFALSKHHASVLHFVSVCDEVFAAFQEGRELKNEVFAWEGCNF